MSSRCTSSSCTTSGSTKLSCVLTVALKSCPRHNRNCFRSVLTIDSAPAPSRFISSKRSSLVQRKAASSSSPLVSGASKSLFPSGFKQASVVLPALMIQIDAGNLMSAAGMADVVSQVVGSGATAVVLTETSGAGGNALFEAVVKLKEQLRGRAALLVVDRIDIVQAAGADGVLLTAQGVPTVVAKRTLASSGGGLVGRIANSSAEAISAAADGASFVLLRAQDGGPPSPSDLTAAQSQQRSGTAIPVLASFTTVAATTPARMAAAWEAPSHADGLSVDVGLLAAAAQAVTGRGGGAEPAQSAELLVTALKNRYSAKATPQPFPSEKPTPSGSERDGSSEKQASPTKSAGSGWARRLLGAESGELLEAEKETLARVMAFLQDIVPDLPEMALLKDAVKQLDEPFLVVVVGEFNSGKSSVINALLGKRFLPEGILPTTNEISILKFDDAPGADSRVERQADGLFVRFLPSRMLEEMHIVDTPGTNVILERQQRLTEEYVPRADLVVFVMSADRPFSESEVRFLEYIHQWKKKVVFVVNKTDILDAHGDVEQVKSFVTDNARRLLKLDNPPVLAVSSRAAIRAKQAVALPDADSSVVSYDADALASNADWKASGFDSLESLVYAFLVGEGQGREAGAAEGGTEARASGAGDTAVEAPTGKQRGVGEGVRLKLQTPLSVADALMGVTAAKLGTEIDAAKEELATVQAISSQLEAFRGAMEQDAYAQRESLEKVLASATKRTDAFIDRTIAFSNAAALAPYLPFFPAPAKASPTQTPALSSKGAQPNTGSGSNASSTSTTATERRAAAVFGSDVTQPHNPVYVAAFESEALGDALDRIREILTEHTAWMETNCNTQLSYYRTFVEKRVAEAEAAGHPLSKAVTDAVASMPDCKVGPSPPDAVGHAGAEGGAVAEALSEFDLRAAALLLDSEVRDTVVGTAYAALGAPALGVIVASWVDSVAQDMLVMGLAGAAAYTAIINLPLRRAEIKRRVAQLAAGFITRVQDRMQDQLLRELEATTSAVLALARPLEEAAAAEVARLEALESHRAQLAREVSDLAHRAASLE